MQAEDPENEINNKKMNPRQTRLALANAPSFCFKKFTKAVHESICKCPLPASTPTPYNRPVGKMVRFVDLKEDS